MPDLVVPARHQPPLPREHFLVTDPPDDEAVPMDVVFVGGGPAGLSGAIELANLVRADNEAGGDLGEIEIAVLEKAEELGQHNLSGAVVNPSGFQALFPDMPVEEFPLRTQVDKERVYVLTGSKAWRIPTPPPMKNHGNYVASVCEIARWLGGKAEELGVNVFTGFPAQALLVDGDAVKGVRTTPTGLNREGEPGPGHEPAADITARVTALSEGTRGPLTQVWKEWQGVKSANPQIYALGVKEIWETKEPLDSVVHTMGWPLPRDAFGGSFMYPMEENLVALGLVVGLDYRQQNLDVHILLQRMKQHPLFKPVFEGGEMLEWGAKTIPEGGFHALPDRLVGDGVVLLGDAAGFVDVPSLKGIHYAMHSGIMAARSIFDALKADDVSKAGLMGYDAAVRDSVIAKDLRRTRNMRPAFTKGFFRGGFKSSLMVLTKGAFPGKKIDMEPDAEAPREPSVDEPFTPDGELTISKLDAVYKAGNQTRDDIPSHLIAAEDLPPAVESFYESMCPAGVYEASKDGLVVNAPNCIDCKATDVLGPRWTPREGGSGPKYKRM